MTEVPKYMVITTSVLASRYNVNGSLARAVLKHLFQRNLIKPILFHSSHCIYTSIAN